MEGFHRVDPENFLKGAESRFLNGSPPVGPSGKALIGGLGGEVSHKLKQNVKLVYKLETLGFNEQKPSLGSIFVRAHNSTKV